MTENDLRTAEEDPRTSMLKSVWAEAGELPLHDAAFHLWRYRHYFDELEFGGSKYDSAEGPTFDRLKRIQPGAADQHIRDAIKAAVKMMDDCEKYFDRNYTDFGRAIDRALNQAKRRNPGFLDDTWLHAGGWLVYVMK